MRIVVTAPTGHIGSELTRLLLDGGAELTLIARNPEKVRAAAARGARVVQGSLEEESAVLDASRGADALFWLTPPNFATPDFRAYQRRLGAIAAKAAAANRVPRVVNLSSVGAQLGHGAGPVDGLAEVEKAIAGSADEVIHLRPGAFMENVLMSLETIKGAGAMFLPVAGGARIPMVATADIAVAAAKLLLEGAPDGTRAPTLYGPEELGYGDVAAILTEVLGKPVAHVRVSPEQARQAMLGAGLRPDMVEQFLELYDSFDTGRIVQGLPASPDLRGATTFRDFAGAVIRPLIG